MSVELICPGLFGPMDLPSGQGPQTPALDRLVVRSDGGRTEARDPLAVLAGQFGLAATSGRDLPSAALCLLADAPGSGVEGFWLHADPVHLYPDRDRLLLFAGPSLDVRPDESAALAASFNDHFRGDGLRLLVAPSGRWYLHAADPPRLLTRPVHAVTGRAVDGFLPSGPDAKAWIRWQNEAQMLFFDHPVNQVRERRGVAMISGVWAWGGGELPSVRGGPDLVIADHPLALGLAQAAGTRVLALGDWQGQLDASASVVVFWDRLWWPALDGDAGSWLARLSGLESVVAVLLGALIGGRIDTLVLDDGHSRRYECSRGRMRRFWRRGRGLVDCLADG